jgi:SAM-dependent methyltransferase
LLLLVSFALAVIGYLFAPLWLIAASLTVIAGTLGTMLLNAAWLPEPYRPLRKRMAEASARAKRHPILLQYFNDGVSQIGRELDSVVKGGFSFQVTHVPQMSVRAMDLVDKTCILTFPIDESERLLTPDTGTAGEYYKAMVAASRRMQEEGLEGVVRIFILKRFESISTPLLKFINKNIQDKIVVRLIFEDELPVPPPGIEGFDFGCYETKDGHSWVMLLRKAATPEAIALTDCIVDTDPHKVENYRRFSKEIFEKSKTHIEFMALLAESVNGDLWPKFFAERGFEISPPHGISDEDADSIIESALENASGAKASILVLGFTPRLIRGLIRRSVANIVSLDQFESKPAEFKGKVDFRSGNWVNTTLDQKFDAIIFDEAINNLSRIQLSLFFPNMRRMLKPGGHIIGRVMGRFEEEVVKKYCRRTEWNAINDLRAVRGSSHEDFASQIVCLLHSEHLAFWPATATVDCARWNDTVNRLRGQKDITEEEARVWQLQFKFALLSPDMDMLLDEAKRSNLNPVRIHEVQGAYVGKCNDVTAFYRIVELEDAQACNGLR